MINKKIRFTEEIKVSKENLRYVKVSDTMRFFENQKQGDEQSFKITIDAAIKKELEEKLTMRRSSIIDHIYVESVEIISNNNYVIINDGEFSDENDLIIKLISFVYSNAHVYTKENGVRYVFCFSPLTQQMEIIYLEDYINYETWDAV